MSTQIPKKKRLLQAAIAIIAAVAASRGFGLCIFLSSGLLGLSIRGLSPARKLFFTILWGGLFAGLFHTWTFLDNWLHWLTLVVVRGVPWFAFCLPQIALERFERDGPISHGFATGLGLALTSWTLVLTPAGFDWEIPMAALAAWPWCLACLPWIGVYGGALMIGLCSQWLLSGDKRATAVGAVALTLWALVSWKLFEARKPTQPPELNIALLQTGWSQRDKWSAKYRSTSKRRLFQMTMEAQKKGAELVIWPETAWPVYGLRKSEKDSGLVSRLAREIDVEILATSIEVVEDGTYNTVSLVTPESGFETQYNKRRLLPFSEYIPILAPVDTLYLKIKPDKGDQQFIPGAEAVLFKSHGYTFTPLVCFESMVPYALSSEVIAKIDFIVVTTNDAGLRRKFPREAHFRSAVLRAAQYRRPIVQAGNTGVTGVIDPYGVVLKRTPEELHGSAILMLEDSPILQSP